MKKLMRSGEPFIWLTGGALAVAIIMIVGLVLLITTSGLSFFWPSSMVRITLDDGTVALGQLRKREAIPDPDAPPGTKVLHRIQLQVGNRDLAGQDFRWIDEARIRSTEHPPDAVLLERREWGNFYGYLREIREGDRVVASGEACWEKLPSMIDEAAALRDRVRVLERDDIGEISRRQERERLAIRRVELTAGRDSDAGRAQIAVHQAAIDRDGEDYRRKVAEIETLRAEMDRRVVVLAAADGAEKTLPAAAIVRALRPNSTGFFGKIGVYASRLREFVWDEPRESNTEGGIFPAIFGTVMMVFLMTVAVVPLGVVAAVYLREYAKQGPLVRAVRIAVNNLAGVPSIVFGVFGLGFFVYLVGGSIDRLFYPEALPTPTYGTGGILWASLTLALLTVPVVIVATEEGLAAVPQDVRQGSLALGATKLETVWRIVIPNAMPGILTGVILAMARAAGEVAPLMITGVVKLAPSLPVDGQFPFVHFERKFMHLGFHIYDVGFQSPNVEAARPMVFMTTLLLLAIVVALNLVAIIVRNRLRKKFRSAAF